MAHSGLSEAKTIIDKLYAEGHSLSMQEKIDICALLSRTSYRGHKELMEILLKK